MNIVNVATKENLNISQWKGQNIKELNRSIKEQEEIINKLLNTNGKRLPYGKY